MRKFFFLMLLIVAGCSNPDKIPDDILGYNKMKFIVWDLINAGEYAKMRIPLDSAAQVKDQTQLYFLEIFKRYDVTKDEFYKSYHYYEAHPDKNKVLMDSVSNLAQRKRTEEYNTIKRIE